jgi:hypothetical protein
MLRVVRRWGVVLAFVLTAAGCGQGTIEKDFTRANYEQLASNPDGYAGARVDIVGRVFVVDREPNGVYFMMFANLQNNRWDTLVDVEDPDFPVDAYELVHVVGDVQPGLVVPRSLAGYSATPIVVAAQAKVIQASCARPAPGCRAH